MLGHFGEPENVSSYWGPSVYDGESYYFVSAILLEVGIAEYKYGHIDASRSPSHASFVLSGSEWSFC
jgi:hypothetical protein